MPLEEAMEEFLKLAADAYTEKELSELVAFYESDVGRKLQRLAPLAFKTAFDTVERGMTSKLGGATAELTAKLKELLG